MKGQNQMIFNLEEELKKLPDSPGVYLMRDSHDNIIYVGKAISLRNRVRQYFRESTKKTPKIEKMVTHIARFEYILTDSELEALILECNLIKKHTPKYNTMLKDGKTYPYIKVTVYEDFPRFFKVRQMKRDKSKYFGPYVNGTAVKDTLELLQKIYQFRTCNRVLPRDIGKERPCLYQHIHQCSAPCAGWISSEKYKQQVKEAMEVLNGNDKNMIAMLKQKMLDASEKMEYEQAAYYRDLMQSVKVVSQKQKITSGEQEDRDIIAYYGEDMDAVVQVFFLRGGKMVGREHFHLSIAPSDSGKEILASFIKQYYAGSPFVPKEILTQLHVEEQESIEQWLTEKRGSKVTIRIPKKGEKDQLVKLAARNAKLIMDQDREKIRIEELMTTGAVSEICNKIGIPYATRMEAFDISNINGFESVGSMIVYEDGKPKRNDYRKFKIKWVKGADDYSSMYEVLTRRFTHGLEEKKELEEKGEDPLLGSFTRFPDLIMMDGGKGQVNIAKKVLEELHLNIPVCGMVKDDHHRTRGLFYDNIEIPIDTHSEEFKLITRIQDEAHRFAIEFHRSLRSKGQVHSILDDIEGIGPARRKALLRKFKSVEAIRDADYEELLNTESMNEAAAKSVYKFFH